jgi:hypothetical protein
MELAADPSVDLRGYDESSCVLFFPDGFINFPGSINYIWSHATSGDYFGTNGNGTNFILNFGGVASAYSNPPDSNVINQKCYAFSWADGNPPDFFTNGRFIATGSSALTKVAPRTYDVSIGAVAGSYIRQIPSTFGAVLATNRALTADEHYQVYEELQATWARFASTPMPPALSRPTICTPATGL